MRIVVLLASAPLGLRDELRPALSRVGLQAAELSEPSETAGSQFGETTMPLLSLHGFVLAEDVAMTDN
jgi:hypothetical protein